MRSSRALSSPHPPPTTGEGRGRLTGLIRCDRPLGQRQAGPRYQEDERDRVPTGHRSTSRRAVTSAERASRLRTQADAAAMEATNSENGPNPPLSFRDVSSGQEGEVVGGGCGDGLGGEMMDIDHRLSSCHPVVGRLDFLSFQLNLKKSHVAFGRKFASRK